MPSGSFNASASSGGIASAALHYHEAPEPVDLSAFRNSVVPEQKYYIATTYEANLKAQLSTQLTTIKRVAICGIAGSGKTVLAKQYLREYQFQYPKHLIRILLAETMEQWWQSLQKLAETLYPGFNEIFNALQSFERKKDFIIETIQKTLSKTPWCIVVDNVELSRDFGIEIIENIFCVGHGTLLLTTQQDESPFPGEHCAINLNKGFSIKESHALLLCILEPLNALLQDLGDESSKEALITELNKLPLALVQAGSYILWENKAHQKRGDCVFTYENYRTLLQEKVNELIEKHRHRLVGKADVPSRTQEAAIILSLEKVIKSTSSNPNMHLWQTLCFCGFLASDAIPQQLLKNYLKQILSDETEEHLKKYIDNMIEEAQRYSLIQFEGERSIIDNLFSLHIHRVIQQVLRDNFWPVLVNDSFLSHTTSTSHADENEIHRLMISAICYDFSPALEKQSFDIIKAYYAHIEFLCTYKLKAISPTEPIYNAYVSLLSDLARSSFLLGDYAKAEVLYLQTLTKQTLKIDVAMTQRNLAVVLERLGRYSEATTLYKEALVTIIDHYGSKHVEVAKTQQNLGMNLMSQGRYIESEEFCNQALRIKIQCKESKKSIARTQENLANTLEKLGKYTDAEKLHREVLATKMEVYENPEKHLEIAMTRGNLAVTLEKLGKYTESETLHRLALAAKIKHYDKTHVEVARTQQNLANTLEKKDEYLEAKELCQDALDKKLHYYGKEGNHISVAVAQQSLAVILVRLSQYIDAEKLCRQALSTNIQFYAETHVEVSVTKRNLALILTLSKKRPTAEAKKLCQDALDVQVIFYKTREHVEVAKTQECLAEILVQERKYQQSIGLLETVLDVKIKHYGETHVEVAKIQIKIAKLFMILQKNTAAIRLFEENLLILIDYYGETHVIVTEAQQDLSDTLENEAQSVLDKRGTKRKVALLSSLPSGSFNSLSNNSSYASSKLIITDNYYESTEEPTDKRRIIATLDNLKPSRGDESKYVKRQDIHDELNKQFSEHSQCVSISAMGGLTGIGKTKLATHFFYHSGKKYSRRFWLSVESGYTIQERFRELAIGLEVLSPTDKDTHPDVILSLVRNFLEANPHWLIVFDDVKNIYEIKKYLHIDGGDILITTTDSTVYDGITQIPIKVMNQDESKELIIKYNKHINIQDQQLITLIELLEYLIWLPFYGHLTKRVKFL